MAETTDTPADTEDAISLARRSLAVLVDRDPQRHPLVVALVAPIGTNLDIVGTHLAESFSRFGYKVESIQLSHLLEQSPYQPWDDLPKRGERNYYERRMNAGDRLRKDVGSGGALAALAVTEISARRQDADEPTVFVLRSLKHPDEEALLRHIYGDAFTLIAISSPIEERRELLAECLSLLQHPSAEAESLIERDEADDTDLMFGQNVRAVFARADAYLPAARGFDSKSAVDRFVDLLFGAPFETPRPEEEAMRLGRC